MGLTAEAQSRSVIQSYINANVYANGIHAITGPIVNTALTNQNNGAVNLISDSSYFQIFVNGQTVNPGAYVLHGIDTVYICTTLNTGNWNLSHFKVNRVIGGGISGYLLKNDTSRHGVAYVTPTFMDSLLYIATGTKLSVPGGTFLSMYDNQWFLENGTHTARWERSTSLGSEMFDSLVSLGGYNTSHVYFIGAFPTAGSSDSVLTRNTTTGKITQLARTAFNFDSTYTFLPPLTHTITLLNDVVGIAGLTSGTTQYSIWYSANTNTAGQITPVSGDALFGTATAPLFHPIWSKNVSNLDSIPFIISSGWGNKITRAKLGNDSTIVIKIDTTTGNKLGARIATQHFVDSLVTASPSGVSSVSGTSPIVSSGGSTPAISFHSISAYSVPANTTSGSATPSGSIAYSTAFGNTGELDAQDNNGNNYSNNFLSNTTSTATAAGTTTLTAASTRYQLFTGTTTQTVVLPSATTLSDGWIFEINNNSTGTLTIETNGGATLFTAPATTYAYVILLTNGTSAGTWDYHWFLPSTNNGTSSGGLTAVYDSTGLVTPHIYGNGGYLTLKTKASQNVTISSKVFTMNCQTSATAYLTLHSGDGGDTLLLTNAVDGGVYTVLVSQPASGSTVAFGWSLNSGTNPTWYTSNGSTSSWGMPVSTVLGYTDIITISIINSIYYVNIATNFHKGEF